MEIDKMIQMLQSEIREPTADRSVIIINVLIEILKYLFNTSTDSHKL